MPWDTTLGVVSRGCRPLRQFSTWYTPDTYAPEGAVDRVAGNNYYNVFISLEGTLGWLQVDFGSEGHLIARVDVLKRVEEWQTFRFKVRQLPSAK